MKQTRADSGQVRREIDLFQFTAVGKCTVADENNAFRNRSDRFQPLASGERFLANFFQLFRQNDRFEPSVAFLKIAVAVENTIRQFAKTGGEIDFGKTFASVKRALAD